MKTIKTIKKLLEVLSQPCTFVQLDTVTHPKGLTKIASVNCATGNSLDYKSVINRRKEKEESEPVKEVQSRSWGKRITGTPLVEHKGKFYLETLVLSSKSKYFNGLENITEEEAQAILGRKKQCSLVHNTYRLVNSPKWRDFSVQSVKGITVNKEKFAVDIS